MSIIYETKEDYEKTVLKEQVDRLNRESVEDRATGVIALAGSWISELEHAKNPESRGWMKYLSLALQVFGAVEIGRSLFTDWTSRNANLQLERTVPPNIIAPYGVDKGESHSQTQITYSQLIEPKSFVELSERSKSDSLTK